VEFHVTAIMWTAGLCGRLACFPCWAWRWGRFRLHNVGVVRVGGRRPLTR
jgi:hypothetical protein